MKFRLVIVLCFAVVLGNSTLFSQGIEFNRTQLSQQANFSSQNSVESQLPQIGQKEKAGPLGYIHVFGGMGFSFLSSSKIKSLIGDDFGIGIGLPTWSYGIRGGIKHLVQVEYNMGDAAHDFNNNSIIEDIPDEIIKMDYDTKDLQIKVNPLFWNCKTNENGFTKAWFIVIGTGDVEWKDKNNDGFEGSSKIYGLEYAGFSKNVSFSFSFKKYVIEFDKTILFNIPFDVKTKASDWIFEMKVGVGLGI